MDIKDSASEGSEGSEEHHKGSLHTLQVHGIFQARILECIFLLQEISPTQDTGMYLPPPGDLPNPGVELLSPASPALADRFFTTEPPMKP